MLYGNHGAAKGFAGGQWSWDTSFNHLGLRWHQDNTTVLAQYIDDHTIMTFMALTSMKK